MVDAISKLIVQDIYDVIEVGSVMSIF